MIRLFAAAVLLTACAEPRPTKTVTMSVRVDTSYLLTTSSGLHCTVRAPMPVAGDTIACLWTSW